MKIGFPWLYSANRFPPTVAFVPVSSLNKSPEFVVATLGFQYKFIMFPVVNELVVVKLNDFPDVVKESRISNLAVGDVVPNPKLPVPKLNHALLFVVPGK